MFIVALFWHKYFTLLTCSSTAPYLCVQELNLKRSDLVISTKLFWGGSGPNDLGTSRKHLIEGIKVTPWPGPLGVPICRVTMTSCDVLSNGTACTDLAAVILVILQPPTYVTVFYLLPCFCVHSSCRRHAALQDRAASLKVLLQVICTCFKSHQTPFI